MTGSLHRSAYFETRSTYIKIQSEHAGPAILWPWYNIKNTSADSDTLLIIPEWLSEEIYIQILI